MIPFTKSNDTYSFFIRGKFLNVPSTHKNIELILEIIGDEYLNIFEKEEKILSIVDVKNEIEAVGGVEVRGSTVYYNGEPVESYFTQKIIEFIEEDLPVSHLLAGFERLQKNPSYRVRENLYKFLEHGNIVWQEDGRFLAFKAVRQNFTDCHTGKFNNSPGSIVEMDRSKVDDDPNNTCSSGLHVCSYEYLNSFHGDRYVVCAVDPADVVSIPNDYNLTKMRVCKYEVLYEIYKEKAKSFHDEYWFSNFDDAYATTMGNWNTVA